MKPVSKAFLNSLLSGKPLFVADLYTFSFFKWQSGGGFASTGIMTFCSGDLDIIDPSTLITYSAGGQSGPFFGSETANNRFRMHQKLGLEVDSFTFDIIPSLSQVFGTGFLDAVHTGQFESAGFMVQRAFMEEYGKLIDTVPLFLGRVGDVSGGESVISFTINSGIELLNQKFPRHTYQASCINVLGAFPCNATVQTFGPISVVSGSTQASILGDITSVLPGFYDQGKIIFTSGLLNNMTRPIRTCTFGTPGTVTLVAPFPIAPAVGDTFLISPGCDKSKGTDTTVIVNGDVHLGWTQIVNISPSDTGITVGMQVSGLGLQAGTYVTGIAGGTAVDISPATIAEIGTTTLTFHNPAGGNGCSKFNNTPNFRGYRFIPQPVTAF